MTVKEFIDKYGLRTHSVQVKSNPFMENHPGMKHFLTVVESSKNDFYFTTPYSMGEGIAKKGPKAVGIINCLIMDALMANDYTLSEYHREFCEGIEDIEKVIAGYNACKTTLENLKEITGETGEFLYNIETD